MGIFFSRLHDSDNSSTIDGLELYKAQLHAMDEEEEKLTQAVKDDVAGKSENIQASLLFLRQT
jgi:hypothetical protein